VGKDNSKNLAGSGEMERDDIRGKNADKRARAGRDLETRKLGVFLAEFRQIVLTVIFGPNASAAKLLRPADIDELCSLRVWWAAAKATGSPDLLRATCVVVPASAALAPRQQ